MDNGAPKRKRGRPKGSKNKNSHENSRHQSGGKNSECSINDMNLISPLSQNQQNLETKTPESMNDNELMMNKKQKLEG